MFNAPPMPHCFSPEHEAFRDALRDFVSREITPHVAAWDEAGGFPRELYHRAAALGFGNTSHPPR